MRNPVIVESDRIMATFRRSPLSYAPMISREIWWRVGGTETGPLSYPEFALCRFVEEAEAEDEDDADLRFEGALPFDFSFAEAAAAPLLLLLVLEDEEEEEEEEGASSNKLESAMFCVGCVWR